MFMFFLEHTKKAYVHFLHQPRPGMQECDYVCTSTFFIYLKDIPKDLAHNIPTWQARTFKLQKCFHIEFVAGESIKKA